MSENLPFRVTFDEVVHYLSHREMSGDFPKDVLRDRLKSIGAPEVLNGSIASQGFPFKYHSPLDEGIMILHYFLCRSQSIPGSYIQINSTHVPNKEEENTLASWKSPKAGLYLDLHALIEDHNLKQCGKKEQIKRLFVFRDHAQLAFLEASAIAVILEQESIGIKTGFLIEREKGRDYTTKLTWAGVLLVQLISERNPNECIWFLGIDKAWPAQHPYRNDVTCRWHPGRVLEHGRATSEAKRESIDLEAYLELFKFIDPEPERKIGNGSYSFRTDLERFGRLLKANYAKAFPDEEVSEELFRDQLKYRAIPANLKQFHLALKQIGQSLQIKAVDASSTKNTLGVHEADPNYRHWIRTSVQCALKNPDKVTLERVYILDEKVDEYTILGQEIDLYRDLMSRKILRLDKAMDPLECDSVSAPEDDFPRNIHLYVITRRMVEKICQEADGDARAALYELLKEDFERKKGTQVSSIMPELDFLYSERLVFNYKDYKGEPGRAFYDADLFMPSSNNAEILKREDGSPPGSEIVTYLSAENFKEKRANYARLFEILKRRSLEILPNRVGGTPLPDFEEALENVVPITIAEIARTPDDDDTATRVTHDSANISPDHFPSDIAPLIFISHASADREKVEILIKRIEEEGYRTWDYQRDVGPGSRAIAEQEEALARCDFFVACHSKDYADRPGESEIEAELHEGVQRAIRMGKGRFMLVLKLDDYKVRQDLRDYWWGDLFKNGEWQEGLFQKLLLAIQGELERRKGRK